MHIRKPLPDELISTKRLAIASFCAFAFAAVLIITIILPAERGIDTTGLGSKFHLTRMGLLKTVMARPDAPETGRPSQSDEVIIVLGPGESTEIKMEMQKGYEANYRWRAVGGSSYHDTHGDPYEDDTVYITYSTADAINSDAGTITAPYSGFHGWYWVNKGATEVTITLNTNGQYDQILEK